MRRVFLLFSVAGCLCAGDDAESETSKVIKLVVDMREKIKRGEIQEVADLNLDNIMVDGKKATGNQKDVALMVLMEWLRDNMTPEREVLVWKLAVECNRIHEEHERVTKMKYLVIGFALFAIACMAFDLFQQNRQTRYLAISLSSSAIAVIILRLFQMNPHIFNSH